MIARFFLSRPHRDAMKPLIVLLSLLVIVRAETPAPPYVRAGKTIKVSEHVWVIPDGRVNLVPNIGIIVGSTATLVVDSGMGPQNGKVTLSEVRKISPTAPLYLTSTHFHPEHVTGFQAFPASAILVRPTVQQEEVANESADFIAMFSKWSPAHAALLKNVVIRASNVTFSDAVDINLGNVTARLIMGGPAHTRGDNFVFIKGEDVLFGGDVVTNRFFPIIDKNGATWIKALNTLAALHPSTVVPGHGEVGDAGLIVRERAFLAQMQKRTHDLKMQGRSAEQTARQLTGELKNEYRDWENPEFLDPGIRRFYAEDVSQKPRR